MLNKFELLTLICTFANDCCFAALKTGKAISGSDETESSYQAIKKALDELYAKTETFNLSRDDFESVLEFLEESEIDYLNVNIQIGDKVKLKTGIKKFNGSLGIVLSKCCNDRHYFVEIIGHKQPEYRYFCAYEIQRFGA